MNLQGHCPMIFRIGMSTTVLAALAAGTAEVAMSEDLRGATFATENQFAMDTMMRAMHAASTGDADRDFVTAMTAHHQGAIAMARAELRYGRNEQLRRIAQKIIIEQQQEIEAMQRAVRASKQPP